MQQIFGQHTKRGILNPHSDLGSDIFTCWKKLQSRCDLSAVKNFPCSKLTKHFKNARMHRVARNSVVALSGNFYTMQLATLRPTKSLENAASSNSRAKN